MAFTSILRRSASSVVPLAIRAVGSQRHHHCAAALFYTVNHRDLSRNISPSSFSPVLRFYSSSNRPSSDESLLRVIESEIKCAVESDDHHRAEKVPGYFPFKLEDNTGQQTITLTREYQGETISVEVHMPSLVTGEDDNENDGNGGDDTESGSQSSLALVVRVSKKNGPCLEFGCNAYFDEVAIESMSIKNPENSEDQIAYEGPDFSDLDENLQKAFHKYLEIRGIKPSTTNFLHEYMINKDSREYLRWLENLKKFVEV